MVACRCRGHAVPGVKTANSMRDFFSKKTGTHRDFVVITVGNYRVK